ncbi:Cdpnpt in complex with Thiolodiphosphate and (S) Benzodiazependione [Aspergillus indologenus CBS 114.80]|uniref:Cdpnpt in complex with Thiolodiphosphate and (S) Benzodiazependione n=1 Tax=Aspergillus indologenus CBS 114.80 TaxID=1450541 RepID=A0A2V5INV3_9EURO|nr:Cdpnpt in complex with Thiolodiphosphate and (S) Benzodiazependione [Aspergillus indologenus CBS 114.80]
MTGPSTTKLGQDGGAGSEPYLHLSRSLRFSSLDEFQYWHHHGPMLGKLLCDGNYSVHQQYEYLCLFAHVIVPSLGPFPSPGRELFQCILGSIGPFELSQNFTKTRSTTRIAYEPTSHRATTGQDPFNRALLPSALHDLKATGAAINLDLHHALLPRLTLSDSDVARLPQSQTAELPFKTQTILALDLGPAGISVKEYFYPTLKAQVTAQSPTQLCIDAIRTIDSEQIFAQGCDALQEYLQQPEQKTEIFLVSCDLVDPHRTRLKFYLAEFDVRFDRVVEHWTMGGQLNKEDPDITEGLAMLDDLWRALDIVEGPRAYPKRPSQPGDPPTYLPLMLNYEIHPGRRAPIPKFYFPISGIPDKKVAAVLTDFFEHHDMPDQAAVYAANLQNYFAGENLEETTHHQAWLSFSYAKSKGPYLTVYYH